MMQRGKRGQGLPMNVVILAIIVIVTMIILLIILVGGTGKFAETVKGIFSGRVSVQSLELATRDCQQLCESASTLQTNTLKTQYCQYSAVVELNSQVTKVGCSANPSESLTPAEERRGIVALGNLGVICEAIPQC